MTMQRGQVRHILNSHYGSVIPYLYETPDWDPPVQGRMPRGGFSVIDSNRGPNATKFHPIKLYHSIDISDYSFEAALRQMQNWDFRQFCRNWSPTEVLELSRQLERVTRYYAPPSTNEKLIAMYFVHESWDPEEVGNADEGDYVPVHDIIHRMHELMRYRTIEFVQKLFAVYALEGNRDFFYNSGGHCRIMRNVEEREHYEGYSAIGT